MSSRRVTTTFRSITAFEWDVAPLPTYGRPVGILHSDAYCITQRLARTRTPHGGSWSSRSSAEGQRIIAATGRTVPSHIERVPVAARSSARRSRRAARRSSSTRSRPCGRCRPISTWPEIEDVTSGILENALYRGDRLDDVIRELDEQTRPLFARGETA